MKLITAPETYQLQPDEISVFLAGGITNCHNWQSDIISRLENHVVDKLVVFNPRRENFPIHDKTAAYEQIAWEFEALQRADIFSMYFCEGESDQPICMYELGRNILHMQMLHPTDWKNRIIVSVEDGYRRKQDVIVQSGLATDDQILITTQVCNEVLLDYHAEYILKAYRQLSVSH